MWSVGVERGGECVIERERVIYMGRVCVAIYRCHIYSTFSYSRCVVIYIGRDRINFSSCRSSVHIWKVGLF